MQIDSKSARRTIFIVNILIIIVVAITEILTGSPLDLVDYAVFGGLLTLMLLIQFVFKKLPSLIVQYLSAIIMIGELIFLCATSQSVNFAHESFIMIICLCSLFLNPRLNIFVIAFTVVFFLVVFFSSNHLFSSNVDFIGENYMKTWMMLISEVIITAIVYAVNKLNTKMMYKAQSTEDLLKLVELKKRQAVENAHLKANFLANMSHEIRTPMNAVIGLTEIILRDPEINDNIRENAYNIKSAGNALITIINDILDFSKIESGKTEISPAKYKISSVVSDTINVIAMRLIGKDVNLITKINPEIPRELVGDDVRIRQILTNLLNNAVKFTKEGSITLEITWSHLSGDKAELKFSVSDTGIGIKKSDIPNIFTSFKRLDDKNTRGIEGTGLGLSIVHNLVKLMGGDITIDSVYGEGTTFTVTIPQRVSDPAPLAEVKNVYEKKVLYIDEVVPSRETAQDNFQRMHVEYELASDIASVANKAGKYYSHLFVSKAIYDANAATIERLASANGKPKIVLILDKNDVATGYSGKTVIRRPVYCTLFSSVLNGEKVVTYDAHIFKEAFTAPGARLLVCDDNMSNLRIMVGLCEPYKVDVVTASSGYEAIDILKNDKFDIIFMDHLMPEIDGVETARLIRQMPFEHCKTTPIVALTANAMSGAREMFLNEGFQGYLAKPIELTELEKVIKDNLSPAQIVRTTVAPVAKVEPTIPLDIDGVDVGVGIHNCGGSRKNYIEILTQVYENAPKVSAMLTNYALEKDYKNYMIQAHALKSVCASIGALELSQYAKEHEFACREERFELVDNEAATLVSRNDMLTENIGAALARIGEKTTAGHKHRAAITVDEIVIAITQVRTHIDDFEPDDAIEALNELLDKDISETTEKTLDEVKKHVCDYEYDEAIEKLDTLVTEIRKVKTDE